MSRALVFLATLLTIGCATSGKLFLIEYEFSDKPTQERIELRYTNGLRRTVCLVPEYWPNSAGKIDATPGTFVLVVGQERFPIERFNTGYCPRCATPVAPGETIIATIPYADFHLPPSLVKEAKSLEFVPKGFHCRNKRK